MITDALLTVSGANTPGSAITGQGPITAQVVSTDKIDLLQARDIGEGENLYMAFTVVIGFAGTGSVAMEIVTDDNAALSSPTVIASTGAIAVGTLTAGKQYFLQIPPQVASLGERYLGARYTTASSPTTGTILAQVVHGLQDGKKFYPRNDNP
jgi:hypothetical protein